MSETKPFASLSSGLLARKGGAKPAMRPQAFGSFGGNIEDLGWNDMGHDAEPAEVAPLSGTAGLTPVARHAEPTAEPRPEPAVVVHQRALEQSFAPEPEQPEAAPEPVASQPAQPEVHLASVVSLPRRPVQASAKGKAAFTLRLDTDRHLKLRLACALTRISAQQLVTGALDEFLKSLPEVDMLADRLPAEASGR